MLEGIKYCSYCINASVCEDLSHDEDLSYHGLALCDNLFHVFFRSGDKKKTGFIFESFDGRWCEIGSFYPSFCPFCGRELVENKILKGR